MLGSRLAVTLDQHNAHATKSFPAAVSSTLHRPHGPLMEPALRLPPDCCETDSVFGAICQPLQREYALQLLDWALAFAANRPVARAHLAKPKCRIHCIALAGAYVASLLQHALAKRAQAPPSCGCGFLTMRACHVCYLPCCGRCASEQLPCCGCAPVPGLLTYLCWTLLRQCPVASISDHTSEESDTWPL